MNDMPVRRMVSRHNVSVPLKYRLWKSEMPERQGEALNISEAGVYFATHAVVEKDETLQIRFQMPPGVVNEPPAEWLCTGQVVRVDRVGGLNGKLGVAVRFDSYQIANPQGTTSIQLDPPAPALGASPHPVAAYPAVLLKPRPGQLRKKNRGAFL
jgi:hypothetical protein